MSIASPSIPISNLKYQKSQKTILFILRNTLYLRNFELPIRQLALSGHHIVILVGEGAKAASDTEQQIECLLNDFGDRISIEYNPLPRDYRFHLASEIQSSQDILFYTGQNYEKAEFARNRIVRKSKPIARFLFARKLFRDAALANKAKKFLSLLKNSLPADRTIIDKLSAINPDLVVISPLIDIRSEQSYWLKAAKILGIRTVLAVASWDNLTNKSCIQEMPGKVIVWNEFQKSEAIELHLVPPENIIITGAQLYDHWFGRQSSLSYTDYCAQFDFNPEEILLVYTGSSVSIAQDESGFVNEWLRHIRLSDHPMLRNANILIRPHPLNQTGLAASDFSQYGNVEIHPKQGGFPVTKTAQNEYFDALYHCSAVVGINTSAILEAAILNKQSFTINMSEFYSTQKGTLHYYYLTRGGMLHESNNFEEHLKALSTLLDRKDGKSKGIDKFVESFLRPHGWDHAATPIFVDALEEIMRNTAEAASERETNPKLHVRFFVELLVLLVAAIYFIVKVFKKLAGTLMPVKS